MLTIGRGTLPADAFVKLVKSARIQHIVDVRTSPKSTRRPHFAREAMQDWVPKAHLSYRWEQRLGGFRRPLAASANVALRNPAFRGYADNMQTPTFWHAFDELLAAVDVSTTAIMCSESLWWHCHRRLGADAAVLTRMIDVEHLSHDGRLTSHQITEGARVRSGFVVYDAIATTQESGHG